MKDELHFKTNTLLKNLLGKDLINDDNIAIIELVKNAYDARSDKVLLRIDGIAREGKIHKASRIVIADEGIGMDLSDIKDKWLNIAYSEKKFAPQDHGSYFAGNKGIGRFSCDRLGEQLDLLTRVKGDKLYHLKIHWPDFEVEGKKDLTIQKIGLKINDVANDIAAQLAGLSQFPHHGTVLVISRLRSAWGHEELLELKRSLEKFLNPNQLFLRDKFHIFLSVPGLEKIDEGKGYRDRVNGEVQNQVFDKLRFNSTYIEATISDIGNTVQIELHHEGEAVFRLVERNVMYLLLKDAKIVIYYLNPYKKAYFKRQTGARSVEFGSVFLFLNGFRVSPYGDRGDDWLGLDVRKAQGTSRYLGSRDLVGRIEVTDNEDQFTPVSSREGLKKTDAFKQLRDDFFYDVLRKLEKFVVDGLDWDSVPDTLRTELRNSEGLDWNETPEQYVQSWERKQQRIVLSILTLIGSSPERIISFWFNPALLEGVYESRIDDVKRLLADIEGWDPDKIDTDLKKGLVRVRKLLAEKEEEAQLAKRAVVELRVSVARQSQEIDKLVSEKETYHAQTLFLQSAVSRDVKDLMAFHHQISQHSTTVDNYIGMAMKALREAQSHTAVIKYLEKATLQNKRISALAQFATMANFRAVVKKEPTDLPAFIEQYLRNVAKDFIAAGLNLPVDNSVKEPFEVKASRIELSILIDNIISNAKKAQAKILTVAISKTSNNILRISFIDDGRGLSRELPSMDSIFDMGITTTSGSGLGLYHARQIVEGIGGKISVNPALPKGVEIRVEVTR